MESIVPFMAGTYASSVPKSVVIVITEGSGGGERGDMSKIGSVLGGRAGAEVRRRIVGREGCGVS
jgi:hypothetical protein